MTNSFTVVAKVFFKYINISAAKNVSKAFIFFFSKNISVFAIFQDKNSIVTLANNFVKFEQPDPDSQMRALG